MFDGMAGLVSMSFDKLLPIVCIWVFWNLQVNAIIERVAVGPGAVERLAGAHHTVLPTGNKQKLLSKTF